MKNILLFLLLIFVYSQSMVAQIGVGTEDPHPSAQLDIFSAEHGILIPRVSLKSTTDVTTIRDGNVNSLMVFNTQTTSDVSPGYYYWYETKWYRLSSTSDDFKETITSLFDQGGGQFLYTSEDGTKTILDIPSTVVEDIINQGSIYAEIIKLIDTNQTVTILENNFDGTYTYYNEMEVDADGKIIGQGVTIDIVGEIVNNITSEGAIYDEIINIFQTEHKTTTLVDGENTVVESLVNNNNTEYKINVPTGEGAKLGVVKEAADNPTVTINKEGELSVNITNLHAVVQTSEDYSPLFDTDATILGNAIGKDIEISLPTPTLNTKGKKYTIKKLNADETYYIHVSGAIQGLNGKSLYTAIPYTGWDFISDGVQWHIVNSF